MAVQRRPATGRPSTGKVRWVVRYRDAAGTARSQSFPRRDLAVERDAELRLSGGGVSSETTVGELVTAWVAKGPRRSTRDNRGRLLSDLGGLAAVRVGDLDARKVSSWADQLTTGRPWAAGRGLSASTAAKRISQLRGLLSVQVDLGVIERNPAARVQGSSSRVRVSPRQVPTREQIGQLRAAAPGWLDLCIRISVATGLRAGEVAGLEVGDVDVARSVVSVSRQCTHVQSETVELKSQASYREVPVPAELVAEMMSAVSGRVVAGPTGQGVSSRIIGAGLARTRRAAGVDPAVSFHGFRHFYASAMLGQSVPLPMVSRLLGHESTATTARVYSHWLPGQMELAAAATERLAVAAA